ncbi:hypothetical protein EIP86_000905 [Pleurotus ostreatoroseus]|nr:hypothetical protein EIP86_000905 [Pleurotus ostreatoroseus]
MGSRLPPGPKGLPILGNILDIPKDGHEWLDYEKWGRQYGSDILYINLLGTPVVILNSWKHAIELFERRSKLYSDRPKAIMLNDLTGWGFDFAFMGYGNVWREQRRVFHQHFNGQAILKYAPQFPRAVHDLLLRLLERPEDFMAHLRHSAGAVIMAITYGIDVLPKDDPYVDIAERALVTLNATCNTGSYLVDYLPALQYIPSWMPGAKFKRQAAIWHQYVMDLTHVPYAAVKQAIAEGTAAPSVVATLINKLDVNEDNTKIEGVIRNVAGAAYTGGADTSVSSLGTLVYALMLHPECQRKAQAELERVIGKGRLPTLEDRDQLPYITAIFRESMRWRPVVPLSVTHALTEDDEYLGYNFPKGLLVIGNIWAISRDEERYPDPERFNPDRFMTPEGTLDPKVPNSDDFAFGFGRRTCPGRHLALNSIWLSLASILTVFNLELPRDKNGEEIRPSGEYTPGLISYPEPFQCKFKPRSQHAEALIRAAAHEAVA